MIKSVITKFFSVFALSKLIKGFKVYKINCNLIQQKKLKDYAIDLPKRGANICHFHIHITPRNEAAIL